jgi:hypothetical protein
MHGRERRSNYRTVRAVLGTVVVVPTVRSRADGGQL